MRAVRDSFQPYLMASGQSKEVPWKVLGGDGAKRDLRRRKEKAATIKSEKQLMFPLIFFWGKP